MGDSSSSGEHARIGSFPEMCLKEMFKCSSQLEVFNSTARLLTPLCCWGLGCSVSLPKMLCFFAGVWLPVKITASAKCLRFQMREAQRWQVQAWRSNIALLKMQ